MTGVRGSTVCLYCEQPITREDDRQYNRMMTYDRDDPNSLRTRTQDTFHIECWQQVRAAVIKAREVRA